MRSGAARRRRVVVASRGDGVVRTGSAGGRKSKSGVDRRFIGVSRGDGIIGVAAVPRWQRGYTLIEVLVAFAVLALALTLLLGTLSGATRQVRWSADAGRAALHAQSLLAQVGVGEALQPGRSEGTFEDGRYRWALEVAPYVDPVLPPAATADPFSPQMLALRLTVAWGQGGARERLQVQSLRLVQPEPDARLTL